MSPFCHDFVQLFLQLQYFLSICFQLLFLVKILLMSKFLDPYHPTFFNEFLGVHVTHYLFLLKGPNWTTNLPVVFLGYSIHHKGYRCLNMQTCHISIYCNVKFDHVHSLYFPVQHSILMPQYMPCQQHRTTLLFRMLQNCLIT